MPPEGSAGDFEEVATIAPADSAQVSGVESSMEKHFRQIQSPQPHASGPMGPIDEVTHLK
jgi:hypothetical protein